MNKKHFGYIGENIACRFLLQKRYEIIEQNFYYYGGEIDIIAFDTENNELVFIEVKTRASDEYGYAVDSVNKMKLMKIVRGARYYIYKKGIHDVDIRFDVIELYYKNKKFYLNHIKQVI